MNVLQCKPICYSFNTCSFMVFFSIGNKSVARSDLRVFWVKYYVELGRGVNFYFTAHNMTSNSQKPLGLVKMIIVDKINYILNHFQRNLQQN